jgi:Tol biopolymer transport system component
VSFSPDGSEFVFVRGILDPPGAELLVAKADGSDVQVLATSEARNQFSLERPSWSPDGARVAVAYTSLDSGGTRSIRLVDVASGDVTSLGDHAWADMTDVAWLADGSGLVTTASEKGSTNRQIWRIDYPSGRATRVTNDLTSYAGVSVSADSRAMVSVQADTVANLWVMPAGDTRAARQLTMGSGRLDGAPGIAWTPDGRIVYGSTVSGNPDIWIMNADGSNQQQLTVDPATEAQPRVCGGGRFIVFTSVRSDVPQVWRMALDGSNPVQLSTGPVGFQPVCAPDVDEVVYTSVAREGRTTIWRVPLEGGEPVLARELQTQTAAMSPDGRTIAGGYIEGQRQSIAVFAIDSEEPPRVYSIFPRPLAWTPDGRALTYIDVRDGVGNIWQQPLPSGTPSQLTDFSSSTLYNFAWSWDGRQLAVSRGDTSTDVVLFSAQPQS